jgi:hypothetical protein
VKDLFLTPSSRGISIMNVVENYYVKQWPKRENEEVESWSEWFKSIR